MKVKHPFRRIKQSFLDLQIRKKLLISFAALIVLPVTLMAVFYLTNSKIILEQKSSVYTSNVLSELKTNLENTVSELDGVFMQLANDPNIQQSIAFLRSDNSTPEERQQGVELANDALRDQLYSGSGTIQFTREGEELGDDAIIDTDTTVSLIDVETLLDVLDIDIASELRDDLRT